MKYKLVERKNPVHKDDPAKTYAIPVWNGMIEIEDLATQIAGRSSLTKGDILNVLQNFLDEIPHYLLMGKAVNLNKLGIFRLNFGSSGATDAKAFNTSQIRKPTVSFLASAQLKKEIQNGIKYTRETPHPTNEGDNGGDDRPDIV